MRSFTALATVMIVASALAGRSQTRPDYSGEWTLSLERSRLDRRIGTGLERGSVQIVHREPSFTFRRVFTVEGQDSRKDYELTTDGTEKTSVDGPVTRQSRLTWEDDVLVLRERMAAPQGEATNTVHYRLLDGGRTLEARESFRGPRLQYDNVWVFERA